MLVTGAGPVGLLAALLGVQRKLEVHVLDLTTTGSSHNSFATSAPTITARTRRAAADFDVIIECTGAPSLVFAVAGHASPDGIVCLAGVSRRARLEVDVGTLNRVDRARRPRDFWIGQRQPPALSGRDRGTRRSGQLLALTSHHAARAARRWRDAFTLEHDDVKTVIDFAPAA